MIDARVLVLACTQRDVAVYGSVGRVGDTNDGGPGQFPAAATSATGSG